MRYRLRTLLIPLALLPPILAVIAPQMAQRFVQQPQLVRAISGSPSQPVFKVYALKDAASAYQLMKQLYAGAPVRFSLDPTSKSLAVLGSPQIQEEIENILNMIEQYSQKNPSHAVPQIKQVTPRMAAEAAMKAKPPSEWHYLPLIRSENADRIQ